MAVGQVVDDVDALFRAVFQGELLKAFQGCLAKAQGGPGLRIRLRLNDVPHLADLPWEYLYDAEGRGFLALSGRTPVVRYLELSEALGTLLVEPPLRVLAVISTPRGYRELAEADEEHEAVLVATFDLAEIEEQRNNWFVFRDRRPELYRALTSYDGGNHDQSG